MYFRYSWSIGISGTFWGTTSCKPHYFNPRCTADLAAPTTKTLSVANQAVANTTWSSAQHLKKVLRKHQEIKKKGFTRSHSSQHLPAYRPLEGSFRHGSKSHQPSMKSSVGCIRCSRGRWGNFQGIQCRFWWWWHLYTPMIFELESSIYNSGYTFI